MKRSVLLCALSLLISISAFAQRLPGGATPEHYALGINLNFPTNSYEGDETIDLKLDKPGNAITLNALEIDFHEVTVTAGGRTQTAKVSTDRQNEMATFTVAKPLPAGSAQVHIKFAGHLNDQLRGFYLSTYNGRKYEVSQMEATDARVAFPCFDEPDYKATFDITAIIDKGDIAISNGKVISDTPGPGNKHTVKFSTSPRMSSYLVALTVGDWKCASDSVDGIALNVCSVPGKENETHFAMEATKAVLRYYGKYYDIKYPLPKLDQIAVPDYEEGAMENWGAIIYRETYLLVDEKTGSVGAKKLIADVIAHEIAHQWFGDLVTMKWWDDVWLNEGFATWMSSHPVVEWKPEWRAGQDVITTINQAMYADSVKAVRPIHQPAESRLEIDGLFDGIAYGKAASILHMLESYLGPETFRAGVNLYLREHAYGNATAHDFWDAMARSSHQPVDKIMPTFVMQPGVPFVDVQAKCEGGNTTLNLAQKRYLETPAAFNEPDAELWQIPICAKGVSGASAGKPQCFLMTQREQQFTMKGCPALVYPDAGAMGYYRFSYDVAALRQLGEKVHQGLTPEERVGLLGNEWALMRVGQHTVGDYLNLAAQLKNTPGADLLADFQGRLGIISTELVTSTDRPEFQAWIRNTFSPLLAELGYQARPSDTPEMQQKRAILFQILGDVGNDPAVIQQANVMVRQYMKDPGAVDPTLAGAVVSVAAHHGDAQLYAQYKTAMAGASATQLYYRYFYALGEFPDPGLLKQTLESTLTPAVRGQDLYVFGGLLANPTSQQATWDFMRTHFTELQKKTGGGLGGAGIFLFGGQAFCSPQRASELQEFFQQHPFPGTERNQRQAQEQIQACIELREQQQPKLAAWLEARPSGGTNSGTAGASGAVK